MTVYCPKTSFFISEVNNPHLTAMIIKYVVNLLPNN